MMKSDLVDESEPIKLVGYNFPNEYSSTVQVNSNSLHVEIGNRKIYLSVYELCHSLSKDMKI